MYGTVARFKVKAGKEEDLMAHNQKYEDINIPGFVATAVYKLDSGDCAYIMAVIFDSKESYRANAESPEQDARFREFASFLEGEPQWMDGEVVSRQVAPG
ncbi:MAG: hypothetical protein QOE92_1437 [Chloroflexota bacterium]|jgi:antibiotic biosynthesis monooxygenase (ABM) superfamily enzyme|nr:hypothetical protein [Chloroflexota bacterium]